MRGRQDCLCRQKLNQSIFSREFFTSVKTLRENLPNQLTDLLHDISHSDLLSDEKSRMDHYPLSIKDISSLVPSPRSKVPMFSSERRRFSTAVIFVYTSLLPDLFLASTPNQEIPILLRHIRTNDGPTSFHF